MPGCQTPELLRSEVYFDVCCNDEGEGQRRRRVFFSNLSVYSLSPVSGVKPAALIP
jgi:hypothetical protein